MAQVATHVSAPIVAVSDGSAVMPPSPSPRQRHRRMRPLTVRQPAAARPDPSASEQAPALLDALRAIERALRVHQIAADRGAAGPRAANAAVLRALTAADAPLTLSTLAGALHRDASSVSVVVARLVADGLIVRRPCPTDRRRAFLHLTAAGQRHAACLRDPACDVLHAALADWAPAHVRATTHLLEALSARLGAVPVRTPDAPDVPDAPATSTRRADQRRTGRARRPRLAVS